MRAFTAALFALTSALAVSAKNVVVTVGKNTTDNATMVFDPAEIVANLNDIVVFNFTEGNHTVTQSTFASPCTPAHDTNSTINGFDSSFRDTVNGTAVTILTVPITPELENQTIWFFDFNTCAQGGVGGINIDDNSTETLDGFVRNAIRLNGTGADNTTSSSASLSPTGASSHSSVPSPTGSTSNSGASPERQLALGAMAVVPLVLAALAL